MALLNELTSNIIDINKFKQHKDLEINAYEIWWADLPRIESKNGKSSIQAGIHPFVIVQNEKASRFNKRVVTGFAITSQQEKSKLPTHVELKANDLNGLNRNSIISVEQPLSIPKDSLESKIGYITKEEVKEIEKAIKIQYNIIESKELDEEKVEELFEEIKYINWLIRNEEDKTKKMIFMKLKKNTSKELLNLYTEAYGDKYGKINLDKKMNSLKQQNVKERMTNKIDSNDEITCELELI